MNLEDIQPTAVSLINGIAAFGAANLLVIEDDGTFPLRAQYNAALCGVPDANGVSWGAGLVVTVLSVEAGDVEGQADTGKTREWVILNVTVEENSAVNRATGGTGIRAEKAIRLIQNNLAGKPTAQLPQTGFLPDSPSFKNMGVNNGVRQFIVTFKVRQFIG